MGKYQYKIVLVLAGAFWFRGRDLDYALERLNSVDLDSGQQPWHYTIKTHDELNYAYKIHNILLKLDNYMIRVESPWLSFYSNSHKDIITLSKIDKNKVKYISSPAEVGRLDKGTIVMPNTHYDFKVTLGKTTTSYQHFVDWAAEHPKFKLTKTCIRDLGKNRSWGGSYFYVSGDNSLLMAKMHLGGCINKVERIVHS